MEDGTCGQTKRSYLSIMRLFYALRENNA